MKNLEKVNVQGNNCIKCSLRGKCPEKTSCHDHYWMEPKLLGNINDFLGTIGNLKKRKMAEEVWVWSENRLKQGKLQPWLKWTMEEMNRTLGTDEWEETKETIMYTGPDNYLMEKPRDQQEKIKQAWWLLVKYQYNKRYAINKKN